jgi:hypothetical protein
MESSIDWKPARTGGVKAESKMTDYVNAWQCIGCGRIEAPQPCIGVCQDRKVQFVYEEDHEEAVRDARLARQNADALRTLVRRLALTTPRSGEWETCYRALQSEARRALASLPAEEMLPGGKAPK